MTVRFASFNVENLFARPKALNQQHWADGEPALDAFSRFNGLIEKPKYTAADKRRMIDLLLQLEVYRRENGIVRRNRVPDPRWAWLRANRGTFDVDHTDTGIEIVATGRSSWTGWLELATEPVDEVATQMTARVIARLEADVLGVVEAENRPALSRFNHELLADQYDHIMLIDGNDPRGIDVGILTSNGVAIADMRSAVDVPDPGEPNDLLFSRDCAQYHCQLPGGARVWVLLNHLKSQSGGGGPKRRRQAQGVRELVEGLISEGERNIVVMGDLNEGPTQLGKLPPDLTPLFEASSPLVDAYTLQGFDTGPRPGTFQSSAIRNRFDYILLSGDLANRFQGGGIERHGLWGDPDNKNPPKDWEIFPEITRSQEAASDHAAIFVDLDL